MAGGLYAATVMCLECLGRADRTAEGIENDQYLCSSCGRGFGIDWSRGAPMAPIWPPTAQEMAQARAIRELMDARKRGQS